MTESTYWQFLGGNPYNIFVATTTAKSKARNFKVKAKLIGNATNWKIPS